MKLLSMKLMIGVYFLLQFIATGFLLAIDMKKGWLAMHILLTAVTSGFYIVIHMRDPGFLQNKNDSKKDISDQVQPKQADPAQQDEPPVTAERLSTLENNDQKDSQIKEQKDSQIKGQKAIQDQNHLESQVQPKQVMPKQGQKRFCRMCKIQQPYRTKHCYDCERCVATFDHHCPWTDSCIGERNRGLFMLYLLLQILELMVAILYIIEFSSSKGEFEKDFLLIIMGLSILFVVLLGLLVFHIYLMVVNLTTWQFLKWNQIPYLGYMEKAHPYPFSKSIKQNVQQYWKTTFSSQKKLWSIEQRPLAKNRKLVPVQP